MGVTQEKTGGLSMNKNVGVFIAGRLASERLPNKLILPVSDTCLWEKAVSKLSSMPDSIDKYALCYDPELVRIVEKYPNVHLVIRDQHTCEVDGPLTYIFKDLRTLPNSHLMFLNPCLYYLSIDTILSAINLFMKSDKNYATSVKPFANWLFDSDGNALMPINYERLTTKEIEPAMQVAHCFHIFNKEQFFIDGQMLKDDFLKLPVSEDETVDVDTRSDYERLLYLEEQKLKDEMRYKIDSCNKKGIPVHVIDVDKTICELESLNYKKAKPIVDRIKYFNELFDQGALVIYSTARSYIHKNDWMYRITENQLNDWGVKYHYLLVGQKLPATYYWDDKAINAVNFFEEDQ